MNNISLMGRMTKDPICQETANGNKVLHFNVAVQRPFSKDTTDFIRCVAWRNAADQLKGAIDISQLEIWAYLAQTAFTYIFVAVATGNASKQTTLDQKQDLRTTKEDLMSELKDSRESLLRESEISTKAIIDILKAEIQREISAVRTEKKGKQYGNQGN